MPDLTTAQDIEQQLSTLPRKIEDKGQEVIDSREEYLGGKAAYELVYQKTILSNKLTKPDLTQTDLKAMAVVAAYDIRIDMIKAESRWRKAKNEHQRLRDDLDCLTERSYNYRQELKTLKG